MRRLLPFLGLLLCSPVFGQVTLDNHANNSSSTVGTTGTCVLPAISANALVLLFEGVDDDGTTTFNTPTATGLTFAQIGTTINNAGNFYMNIWRAYTSSSLGSTTITGTWNTTSADWAFNCASITGTAGTAGNNGSDAIGNTSIVNLGSTANPTTTVTSSSHNNSKYFGAFVGASASTFSWTVGGSYSAVTATLWNSNFIGVMSELSTNPVTPAANTAVNATSGSARQTGEAAVEILVNTGGGGSTCTSKVRLKGVGCI